MIQRLKGSSKCSSETWHYGANLM